ncbi:MAG: DUF4433 domain-containing protein [Erysipelotrichaceae bacterium]
MTHKKGLYNIQAICNIPSIMKRGLLSNEEASKFDHKSIAMDEVQEKRACVKIPNGLQLHKYANLYFDYYNPMLSRVRKYNQDICILNFSASILDSRGVILSDRNASSTYAAFYDAKMGLDNIDFELVYARYWTDGNYYNQLTKKSVKCAEVLVPYCVPFAYVKCAAVFNDVAKEKLMETGFNREIIVEPTCFF